jgi:hypothetical protein
MKCALCGRSMRQPAVTIGALGIGPTCARKAGLIDLARKKTGMLRLVSVKREITKTYMGDLFDDERLALSDQR